MTFLDAPTPSKPPLNPYRLGATLYMPATRQDIWQIITLQKLADIDSIVLCFEDALHEKDIPTALANLKKILQQWQTQQTITPFVRGIHRPLVFIRPRHVQMLLDFANWQHIELVDGFVLPKIDMNTLADWRLAAQLLPDEHLFMPTLETRLIFNPVHNQELAVALSEGFKQSLLALRIGGNDLFACLRLRRSPELTIYQSPVGILIYQLIACFVPYGFYLTAPVFEYLDRTTLFEAELRQDVALGLVGKTVIHPSQIPAVKTAFRVSDTELAQANAILATEAAAVFKQDNSMLEPATHKAWAQTILARSQI